MLVTIGIPFYNAESTLLNSIRSVFSQTFQDWELILVDDGSSDRSLQLVQAIDDSRVKVVADGHNRGLPYRLNQIARLAKGKYIARMDADDLMHPERIQAQADFMERHPEVDLVGSDSFVIDENDWITGVRSSSMNFEPEKALQRGIFIHPTVFGKTEWFRENPYSGEYVRAEDHEVWLRSLARSHFAKLQVPLLFYRVSGKVNLKGHLLSYKTDRKILKEYGPEIIGSKGTNGLVVKSYLKSLACMVLAMLRMDKWITQGGITSDLSIEERNRAGSVMSSITHTPIPGIDQIRKEPKEN